MEDDHAPTSLLAQMDEKASQKEKTSREEQYLQEAVEALRRGAPVIGERPWANYVEPISGSEDTNLFVRGNVNRNLLPLSYKIVPLPAHTVSNRMKDHFDMMAITDSHRATTVPTVAHSLSMFTPSLLILLMATPSKRGLDEIYQSCLEVARRWKASNDPAERANLTQNLVELHGIYEEEEKKLTLETSNERIWPERTNAIEVIVQYRRVMNLIRLTNGFAEIDEDYASEMAALIHKCDRFMARGPSFARSALLERCMI